METNRQNRLVLLMFLLLFLCGQTLPASELESIKKKEIVKTYPMAPSGKLAIENKYGNIIVSHWNRNEVSIRVVIESKGRNDRFAQESLDRVQVVFQEAKNYVSAVTSLEENRWGGNNRGQQLSIHYYVSIPPKLNMDLNQKYGSINLPGKNEGKCRLEVKYGNINAGSFTEPLDVDAKYSNVLLGDVTTALFNLGYCGKVKIARAEKLNIDSKYSNEEIDQVESLILEKKYGNGTIDRVKTASIEAKYSDVKLGTVERSIVAEAVEYGTLSIRELDAKFERVQVSARYGNLNIWISPDASFQVRANEMKYGGFDLKGLHITHSTEGKEIHSAEINGGKNGQIQFNGGNYSNISIKAK